MRYDALQALLTLRQSVARWAAGSAAGPRFRVAACAQHANGSLVGAASGAAAEAGPRISCAWLPRPPAQGRAPTAAVLTAANADQLAETAVLRTLAVIALGRSTADGAASSGLLSPAGQQRLPIASLLAPSQTLFRSLAVSGGPASRMRSAAQQPPSADKALGQTHADQLQNESACSVAAIVNEHGDQSRLAQRRSCLDPPAAFAGPSASSGHLGSSWSVLYQPANLYSRQAAWPQLVKLPAAQPGRGHGQRWFVSSPATRRSTYTTGQPPCLHLEPRGGACQLLGRRTARACQLPLADVLRGQSMWRACAGQQARGVCDPSEQRRLVEGFPGARLLSRCTGLAVTSYAERTQASSMFQPSLSHSTACVQRTPSRSQSKRTASQRTLCDGHIAVGWQAKRAARDNSAPEVDAGPKLRVNDQITAPVVRLVFAGGGHQARYLLATRLALSLRMLHLHCASSMPLHASSAGRHRLRIALFTELCVHTLQQAVGLCPPCCAPSQTAAVRRDQLSSAEQVMLCS